MNIVEASRHSFFSCGYVFSTTMSSFGLSGFCTRAWTGGVLLSHPSHFFRLKSSRTYAPSTYEKHAASIPTPNNTACDTRLDAHTATLVSTSTSHRHKSPRSASSLCRAWAFFLSLPSKMGHRYFLSTTLFILGW